MLAQPCQLAVSSVVPLPTGAALTFGVAWYPFVGLGELRIKLMLSSVKCWNSVTWGLLHVSSLFLSPPSSSLTLQRIKAEEPKSRVLPETKDSTGPQGEQPASSGFDFSLCQALLF